MQFALVGEAGNVYCGVSNCQYYFYHLCCTKKVETLINTFSLSLVFPATPHYWLSCCTLTTASNFVKFQCRPVWILLQVDWINNLNGHFTADFQYFQQFFFVPLLFCIPLCVSDWKNYNSYYRFLSFDILILFTKFLSLQRELVLIQGFLVADVAF